MDNQTLIQANNTQRDTIRETNKLLFEKLAMIKALRMELSLFKGIVKALMMGRSN